MRVSNEIKKVDADFGRQYHGKQGIGMKFTGAGIHQPNFEEYNKPIRVDVLIGPLGSTPDY